VLIRKLFKFENAHIVRGCSTQRCARSIHGHSYKVELLLEAHSLDNAQMLYDFGLLKKDVGGLIDAFDHAITLWAGDSPEYIREMQRHSERWVVLPVSPSAEQFSRVFFRLADYALTRSAMKQSRAVGLNLYSVIVHETDTGYAQCFREDVLNPDMGLIDLEKLEFSPAVIAEWNDPELFENMKRGL